MVLFVEILEKKEKTKERKKPSELLSNNYSKVSGYQINIQKVKVKSLSHIRLFATHGL